MDAGTALAVPVVEPDIDETPVERPRLSRIIRHLALSLLMANIIPTGLFYVCLVTGNVWAALIAALVWCYGAMAWRMRTKRPTSGLLWLTVIGLTAKTAFALATGSTLMYFLQPALTDIVIGAVFLASLASARPVVARLACDFYPMSHDVASRPRIQRLFWHLTLFWAALCLGRAVTTLWLLSALSLDWFVAAKSILTVGIAVIGAGLTVAWACKVARREGLLACRVARTF